MSPVIFTSVINSYFQEPEASLLNGILFGVPLHTSGVFYEQLRVVGLLHIVVLSGMNITFLAAFVMKLTSMFSKIASCLITSILIILFVFFVGPQAPIVRAAIMGILTLVSIILGRKTLALYSLLTSVVVIAFIKLEWLSTISFQLSFGATLGIILFGGSFKSQESTPTMSQSVLGYIKENLRISLAAQIFTAPIIFIYFRQISLISPISNILVSWTIEPLMIFGFVTAITGLLWQQLGYVFSGLCYGLLLYFITVVDILSSMPLINVTF